VPAGEEKILYHYTNQKGLLGILQNREIWATHSQYLNDEREFLHALDLCKTEIADRKSKLDAESETARVLSRMEDVSKWSPETTNLFVSSFSEEPDSLPQWRAYGRGGTGYAIGFSERFLREVSERNHWLLDRCVYDSTLQNHIVGKIIDNVLAKTLSQVLADISFRHPGASLSANLSETALFLKHESFVEEREWRIVSQPISSTHERVCFREGKSVLIPFYKLSLLNSQNFCQVSHIVIGPTPNEKLAYRSVRTFLLKEKLSSFEIDKEVPISISQVPYRDW